MSASVRSANLRSGNIPELAHRTSIPPSRCAAVSATRAQSSRELTSASAAETSAPSADNSPTVARGLLVPAHDEDSRAIAGEHPRDALADVAGVPGAEFARDVDRRVRADPRDKQQPPEQDERPDLRLVPRGKRGGPAVTGQPTVDQSRPLRLVLEEAHRCPHVVEVPAEAAVIEVEDADPAVGVRVVDEQVGKPGVGVDQAIAV